MNNNIIYLKQCLSTNTELLNLIKQNGGNDLQNGLVIYTDNQLQGRGQHNKKWISESANTLTFSFLWKITEAKQLNAITLSIGLAVYNALNELKLNNIGLKFVNDILYYDQQNNNYYKLAGILVEAIKNNIVIGIGVNVNKLQQNNTENNNNNNNKNKNKNKNYQAISINEILQNESKISSEISKKLVLETIILHLHKTLQIHNQNGFIVLKKSWLKSCFWLGKNIIYKNDTENIFGDFIGISDNGEIEILTQQMQVIKRNNGSIWKA